MNNFGVPNVRTFGDSIVVVDIESSSRVAAQRLVWAYAATMRDVRGVRECVPGLNNLTVLFDPLTTSAESVTDALSNVEIAAMPAETLVEIPVRYDGEDLEPVAQACAMTVHDVIALHASREYVAYFLGFQPGFAYLGEVDERLRTSRRASPRARVPAQSVAIAETLTAVYPFASPGGWNIIGRTDVSMFDVTRVQAPLIMPGDRVRFVPL